MHVAVYKGKRKQISILPWKLKTRGWEKGEEELNIASMCLPVIIIASLTWEMFCIQFIIEHCSLYQKINPKQVHLIYFKIVTLSLALETELCCMNHAAVNVCSVMYTLPATRTLSHQLPLQSRKEMLSAKGLTCLLGLTSSQGVFTCLSGLWWIHLSFGTLWCSPEVGEEEKNIENTAHLTGFITSAKCIYVTNRIDAAL